MTTIKDTPGVKAILRSKILSYGLASGILLLLTLPGCGNSSQVERKHVVERRRADESPAGPAGHGMQQSPHGAAMPSDVAQPSVEIRDGNVELGQIHLSAPKSWTPKPSASGFILAEFALPRSEEDTVDGRLTISSAGGTIDENIDRWRQQFGGKPEESSVEKFEVDGVPVTLADFSGTFQDQRGGMGPAEDRPAYRMLGAIAEIDGKLYFIKAYGPRKTIAAHADEFRAFLRTSRLKRSSD